MCFARRIYLLVILPIGTIGCTVNPENLVGAADVSNRLLVSTSVNAIVDATQFSGADIGEKINAAYAALPPNGGRIDVPVPAAGFIFSTPIVIGTAAKPATIACSSNGGAGASRGALRFTPTSGIAVTFDVATSETVTAIPRGYGLRNCFLQGSQGTSIGLFLGGPHGAEGFTDESSTINGFGTDLKVGDNTFFVRFTGTYFGQDTVGVLVDIPHATNTGEEVVFDSVTFHEGNAGAVVINGAQVSFQNAAFDNAQLVANSAYVSCVSCHFEDPDSPISYPFIVSSGNLSIINTQILEDHPAQGTATSAISVKGGTAIIIGLDGIFQNPSYTAVIEVSGNASVYELSPASLQNTVPMLGGTTTGRYLAENDPQCFNSGDPTSCPLYLSNLPISTNGDFLAGAPQSGYQTGAHLQFQGTRMQATPDNQGFFTGKYLIARDISDGCNPYASEADIYTENKVAPNADDTSTIAGRIDCHGFYHATAGIIAPLVRTNVYTVASLPSAAAAGAGGMVTVNDATTYTAGPCIGGGDHTVIAVSDGSQWSCH